MEVTQEELKDFHEFFEVELHVWATICMAGILLIGTILFLSKYDLTPDSRFIYGIYALFLCTVGFTLYAAVNCLLVLLIMFLVDKERFSIFESKRVRHCVNKTKKELQGRSYLILHVLFIRYAFRVSERRS